MINVPCCSCFQKSNISLNTPGNEITIISPYFSYRTNRIKCKNGFNITKMIYFIKSIHESALGLKMMGILTSVNSLLLCANTFELKCTIYQLPPCHNIHTSESFKHARYEWRLLFSRAASQSGL